MGRTLSQSAPMQPSGFYQEINTSMLEDMWRTMAAQTHPEEALDRRRGPPTTEECFDWLKDATWDDFWNVFPYELREHGSYLDELDALALLLASPVSKQRFQRYFEQYASVIVPAAADTHSRVVSRPPRQRRLGLPLFSLDNAAGDDMQQHHYHLQQQGQPVRRRGQLDAFGPGRQQQLGLGFNPYHPPHLQQLEHAGGGPVVYVSPAAPGRLLAAAQPGPSAAAAAGSAQQQGTARNTFLGNVLSAFGLDDLPGERALPEGAQFRAAAAATGHGHGDLAVAAPPLQHLGITTGGPSGAGTSAAAAAAADGQRLTGRRRSWVEACDTDTQGVDPAHQQAAGAADAGAAGVNTAAGVAASTAAAAAAAARDASRMWRAVHEALTEDDEPLLAIVSRLVPYSFSGQLCSEADTRKQLQALADSRPVPQQVVRAIADRLASPSEAQLVRLTASSGYSKRAAAAAAALECTTRTPFYIPLAGCHTLEAVEAAIMRGIFGDRQEQQQEQPQQPLAQADQQQEQRRQQQEAVAQDLPRAAEGDAVPTAAAAEGRVVLTEVATQPVANAAAAAAGEGTADVTPAAIAETEQAAARAWAVFVERTTMATTAAAAGVDAAAAGHGQQQLQQQQQRELEAPSPDAAARRLRILRGIAEFVGDMGMGVTLMDGSQEEEEEDLLAYEDSEGGDDLRDSGLDRCAEQLNAHLTLLGTCSKQPLLVVLDEADSAMLSGGGAPFKSLLLRMLFQLPQVVVMVTDTFEPESYIHSHGGSVLRPQGAPAVYQLPDGKLTVGSYRLPRPLYHHCLHCC